MGVVLTMTWLFFSLPWVVLVLVMSPMGMASPDATVAGWLGMVALLGFGPPTLFGLILWLIKAYFSGSFGMGFLIKALLVLSIFGAGASGGVQVCTTNSGLCSSMASSFIGMNSFTAIGLPLLLLGWGLWQWIKLPKELPFWEKINAVIESMLKWPKRAGLWIAARFKAAPA